VVLQVVPSSCAVSCEDPGSDEGQSGQYPVRGPGQGVRALLRTAQDKRRLPRRVQDPLARGPASEYPERPRQGQGLPGPPGPGSDRQEGGSPVSATIPDVTHYT